MEIKVQIIKITRNCEIGIIDTDLIIELAKIEIEIDLLELRKLLYELIAEKEIIVINNKYHYNDIHLDTENS